MCRKNFYIYHVLWIALKKSNPCLFNLRYYAEASIEWLADGLALSYAALKKRRSKWRQCVRGDPPGNRTNVLPRSISPNYSASRY